LEVFIDFQCEASKRAFAKVQALAKLYPKQLGVVFYVFVLAWHRQAVNLTKAAWVASKGDTTKWFEVANYLYDKQDEFLNEPSKKRTEEEVNAHLARHIVKFLKADEKQVEAVKNEIEQEATLNAVKPSFRLAIKRGVWQSPTFFINGSEATSISSKSEMEAWQALLDPLIKASL